MTPDHQGVIPIVAETHLGATVDDHTQSSSLINMHENPSYTTLPGMQPEYEMPTEVIVPHHTPHDYEIPVSGSEDATDAICYSDVIYEEVQ